MITDFNKLPIRLLTLDTETRGLNGAIFRVGIFDGDEYFVSDSFIDIQNYLLDLSIAYELHIYVHNLDFDLSKIADYLEGEIKFKNSLFINNRATTVVTKLAIFHDSYSLLSDSLENLCESFGLAEKGKMDFIPALEKSDPKYLVYNIARGEKKFIREENRIVEIYKKIDPEINIKKTKNTFFNFVPSDDPILNDYLKLDCTSLYDLLTLVMEIAEIEIDQFIMCPTVASLSMRLYRTNFNDDYKKATQQMWKGSFRVEELFLREAYFGGRTEVFTPILYHGFHYDVVSLYPYVMKKHEYPIGRYFKKYEGDEALSCFRVWKRKQKGAGFLKCKVHIPFMNIPPLPIRSAELKKLCFPVGDITGTWTFHELEMAIDEGCHILESYEAMYWKETADIFSNYISFWEEMKNTSTGAKREFAKRMLNNLYGKFGTQRNRVNYTDNTLEERAELEKKNIPYEECEFPLIKKDVLRFEKTLESQYIQVHLSAYVTSFARMYLYKMLRRIEKAGGTLFYCDTDSIVTDKRIEDFDPEIVGEKVFGKWTLEKELDYGLFLQPKMYYEQYSSGGETKKGKGIPSEILREEWNKEWYEFMVAMIVDEKTETIPIYKQRESRQKFLTALRMDKDFNEIVYLTKNINLQAMQKRKMDFKNNRSDPHELKIDLFDMEKYFEEMEKENKRIEKEYTDWYEIEQGVKKYGYPRVIVKGEKYYREYQEFSNRIKRKFFRIEGMDFEEFCECIGYEPSLLIEDFRLAYID